MRNICDLDCLEGTCTGSTSMGCGDNSIEIKVRLQPKEVEYLQIETNSKTYQITNYTKDDKFLYYTLPFFLYKEIGMMYIKVKYVDGYGTQFTFKTEKLLLDDSEIMVKYLDGIFFVRRFQNTSDSPYDIPIASHENLGVVQIGNTISVSSKGVIEMTKGGSVEAITNIDIDYICK